MGRYKEAGPRPQAFIAANSLSWYSRPTPITTASNMPTGTKTVRFCTEVSAMTAPTISRGN